MAKAKLSRRSFIAGAAGIIAAAPALARSESLSVNSVDGEILPVRKKLPNPYIEGGKPIVVIVEGDYYPAMLAKAMEELGGFARFGKDKSVLLKPNFIRDIKTDFPITTCPEAVLSTVDSLYSEGFTRITVADSRNIKDGKPVGMFNYGGINEAAAKKGFQTSGLIDEEVVKVKGKSWKILPHVGVYKRLYETDIIINMPVVKEHLMTAFTCALKNNMGSIDEATCMLMHYWGKEYKSIHDSMPRDKVHQRLCQSIAEAAEAVNADLTIIDARKVLAKSHLEMPKGEVLTANKLIISGDQLAADVIAAEVFKEVHPALDIKHSHETFKIAAELGIGVAEKSQMVIKKLSI